MTSWLLLFKRQHSLPQSNTVGNIMFLPSYFFESCFLQMMPLLAMSITIYAVIYGFSLVPNKFENRTNPECILATTCKAAPSLINIPTSSPSETILQLQVYLRQFQLL